MINPPLAALSGSPYYKVVKPFIYTLDKGLCHICKKPVKFNEATLDHIIPISGTGFKTTNAYWNLRLAHHYCNIKRCNGKIAGQLRLPIYEKIYYGGKLYAMSRM